MKKIFLIPLFFLTTKLYSQLEIPTAIVGGEVAKSVIDKFEQTASKLLSQANSAGNALLSKAGNELNVASKNASLLLSDQLNTTFDKLSAENQKLLNEIEQFRLTAEKISLGTFDLKDALVIDLKKILGDALPWSRTDFYVQNIKGAIQLIQNEADYSLTILGIGFGYNQDGYQSKISAVYVNDKKINFNENKLSGNESQLLLSHSEVNDLAVEKKITQIKARVIVETKRKEGFIFKSWHTKTFDLPITISLLSKRLSNISVKYTFTKYDWQVVVPSSKYHSDLPDHNQGDSHNILHFPWTTEIRLPDNQRFTKPVAYSQQAQGEGAGCPWTTFQSLTILENGKLLSAKFDTWGPPCRYYFEATIEEFKETNPINDSLPRMFFEYGKNFVIELPKGAKYWQIQGQTLDFKEIDLIGKRNFSSLLTYQDTYPVGDIIRVVYKVGLPY